ncbi:hypothetical protein LEP1GSC036_1069 [Leptospira weilii str. 2006001853]|uniref:Uncharacterized protein n=2 Tax=Leptospira weilii TaxID=28184 RepID=A0A828YZ22_9LEPT|nr:hypothetical protein LEP1GSC036_1069 [Leptospira weilii str. 2006001853]EMJ66415.1 hypothetical protein LEP1GSC051_1876 [Leptospira sp. P2653]EMN44945.1 hypothetical protein LEP1GSC086_0153 [Leptospira weilii str. LNT 1234]EMN92283.1 hypothetical protein LEP1GSC108_2770 [Leptospira weilii str. UI 13098]
MNCRTYVNLLSGLVVFSFFPKKPSLNLRSKNNFQLWLFH